MLSCHFTNGDVECDNKTCCTWERKVTDVFRVYIHNVSRELEGRFWGFVLPADKTEQESCNFTLKASTCLRDSINATNGQVNCSSQPVTIGQTCTVTCSAGHYFRENQTSVTYTCVGKNQWSPDITDTSCEVPTCSIDYINVTNSHVICSEIPVSVGKKCNVTCNTGYFMQDNQTSMEYNCEENGKWIPANSVKFCHEQSKVHNTHTLYYLFLLLFAIFIVIGLLLFRKRRKDRKTRRRPRSKEDVEQHLLTDSNTVKTSTDSKGQPVLHTAENYWRECIKIWYPEFHSRTYFLPPLYFNRESFSTKNVADKQVLVPQDPQSMSNRNHISCSHIPPNVTDNDMREDRALQRVLHGIHALADNGQEREVMFVISHLQFDNYLGEPNFAHAAAHLPRHSTRSEDFRQKHYNTRGFDVLIIHRQHGLLILQISSVGEDFKQQTLTDQEEAVKQKVEEVAKQLNEAEYVLKHITSDLKPVINITKCLVMPNVTYEQLEQVISKFPSVGESLCQCLGVQTGDCVMKLSLLSDQLSDKQTLSDINHSSLQGLRMWWQYVVRVHRSQPLMPFSLYEELVARFCGPATTVEVHSVTTPRLNIRTRGEAVSETGERVARLVLFPQQLDILNQSPPRAFLSGPPGTGKTIVLIMQGLTWIQRGFNVHVVSTWDGSRAVTMVIEHQLLETAKKSSTDSSRVHRHQFDLRKDEEQLEIAIGRLKSMSERRQLCVIADEAVDDDNSRQYFTQFCDKLIEEVPGVYIWGASVHHGIRPLCLEEFKLTTPLRSPPVVVREVMKSSEIKNEAIHDYTVSDTPVPTDGPPIIRIKQHQNNSGHTGVRPLDCITCGHQVARVLKELDVGQTVYTKVTPPLKYRDVLVLCVNCPTEDRVHNNGQVITTASGLVQGLRDRDVPVHVVEEGNEAAIRDTALAAIDKVTVARWRDILGLERKVVVVESGSAESDVSNRLCSISRCTSQLVVIDR